MQQQNGGGGTKAPNAPIGEPKIDFVKVQRSIKIYSEIPKSESSKSLGKQIQFSDIYLGFQTKHMSLKRFLCTSPSSVLAITK